MVVAVYGYGPIGQQWVSCLLQLGAEVFVVTKTERGASQCRSDYSAAVVKPKLVLKKVEVTKTILRSVDVVIVAIPALDSFGTVKDLVELGVKRIVCEKPCTICVHHVSYLKKILNKNQEIFVAFNRRFFPSIFALQEEINVADVKSVFLSLGESESRYLGVRDPKIIQNWLEINTLHMVDLAIFLFGKSQFQGPLIETAGPGCAMLPYRKLKVNFPSSDMALRISADFKYGGWGLKVTTAVASYYLRPIETLRTKNSIISNSVSGVHKPGYMEMCSQLLRNEMSRFCTLEQLAFGLNFCGLLRDERISEKH